MVERPFPSGFIMSILFLFKKHHLIKRLFFLFFRCRLKYGVSFFVSLVTPLAALMVLSCLVFIIAMRNIFHRSNIGWPGLSKNENKKLLKAAINLFTSLGLIWITGLLVLIDAGTALQWIFTIFVSSQGLFIFLLQRTIFAREKEKHQEGHSGTRSSSGFFSTLLRKTKPSWFHMDYTARMATLAPSTGFHGCQAKMVCLR